jgi:hypothetical protein
VYQSDRGPVQAASSRCGRGEGPFVQPLEMSDRHRDDASDKARSCAESLMKAGNWNGRLGVKAAIPFTSDGPRESTTAPTLTSASTLKTREPPTQSLRTVPRRSMTPAARNFVVSGFGVDAVVVRTEV